MGNCLKTQLKENVNNDNLIKVGEMKIFFPQVETPSSDNLHFKFKTGVNVELRVLNGTFMDSTFSTSEGTTKNVVADSNVDIYISNTNATLIIPSKYSIINISCDNTWTLKPITFTLDDLKYSDSLSDLSVKNGVNLRGSLDGTFNSLTNLYLTSGSVELQKFDAPNINYCVIEHCVGNVNMLSKYTNAYSLELYGQEMTGNINSITLSANIVKFVLDSSSITGSIEALAASVATSRNSGQIRCTFTGTQITYNGQVMNSEKIIKFGSSMVNPTPEETAQGWQIV